MEIVEKDDLVIALVERDEIDGRPLPPPPGAPEIDVLRLVDSEKLDEATLDRLGFVARPEWINWVAPVGGSQAEFLAGLSRAGRSNVVASQRALDGAGLRVEVCDGLGEAFFEEFLGLYDAQVARMPRGRNFARRWKDRLLEARSEMVTVAAYSATGMAAGAIWWVRAPESMLQLRFSAVSEDRRVATTVRALYLHALQAARQRGLRHASLGNDPALFGHVVQPGLYTFKARFGFTPIPSVPVDPRLWGEFADRFLTLRRLADPSLVVTWGPHRGETLTWPAAAVTTRLGLAVLSGSQQPPDSGDTAAGGLGSRLGTARHVRVPPDPYGDAAART